MAPVGPVTDRQALALAMQMPTKSFVRQFVAWGGKRTSAPYAFHLNCAMATLAPLLSPQILIDYHGKVPVKWWGTLIGEHGTTYKSTCLEFSEELLLEINDDLVAENVGSWEGQIESVRAQPQQLIIHSDLGAFLEQTSDGYMQNVRTQYLQLWDNRPLGRRLAGSEEGGKIVDHRVSVIGGSTPEQIEESTSSRDWSNGFMSRWCHMAGTAEKPGWERPTGGALNRDFLIERLTYVNSIPALPCAGLTDAAADMHEKFQKALHVAMEKGNSLMRGTYSRAGTLAIRAAILFCADFGGMGESSSWYITPEVLAPAYGLVKLHLQSTAWLLSTVCGTMYQRNRRAFLRLLPESGDAVDLSFIASTLRLEPRRIKDVIDGLEAECAILAVTGSRPESTAYRLRTKGVAMTHGADDANNG